MTGVVSGSGKRWRFAATVVAGLCLGTGFAVPAIAKDYSFKASYRVTLNGLSVGKAMLLGSFDGSSYRLDGQGRLTGIAGILVDYSASAASAGRIGGSQPTPSAFSVDASDGRRSASLRMTLAGNRVRDVTINPEPKPDHPSRVKITSAHTRDVLDPMSALIAPGGYADGSFDRSVCNRTVPVFNGRERFDVALVYKGTETVSNRNGYSGPVMVCEARYRPVSGHRSDRDEVKYMAEKVVVDVMLAPIEGSDLLVPYRASLRTPLGTCVIEVTEMASQGALQTRAASLRIAD